MARGIILADDPAQVVIRCVEKTSEFTSWVNHPVATYGTNMDRSLAHVFDDPDEADRQAVEARVKWPDHDWIVEPAS